MSKASRIRVGVDDLYVAKATLDEETSKVTYETPIVFGGTASISVSQQKGENKVFESDQMIRNYSRISGANINYTSRTVPLAQEMDMLYSQDAESGEDGFEDGPEDVPRNCAVGWASKLSDGGYRCVWYYWCTGSKGDESYETATESESSPTDSYDFAAMPSPETRKMRRRKIVSNAAERDAFFASVLPTGT